MTGYGDAEGQLNGVTYSVEIRTLNNRYFKARMKLPDSVAFLEDDIEKLLLKNLSRGMVNYALRLKNVSTDALFDIDETGLRAYMEKLSRIAASVDIECPVDIGSLLTLPGMLTPVLPEGETAGQVKRKVLSITQKAIEKVKQMRAAEGAALSADLDNHCKSIKQNLEQIRARRAAVLAEYAKRLKKRVGELLAEAKLELDEAALAREVAIFAERSDISEEIARLDSHLQQFVKSCQGSPLSGNSDGSNPSANNQAGRRLDFISQEMLREANTIASKASDIEIAHCVVDIKCRIDRIKEQVQNIE
jgi:uncharacterized protein (TIGR00255 family)